MICKNNEKIKQIKSYYAEKLCQTKDEHAILGWEDKKSQHLRFDALIDNVKLESLKILDVGCGLGNLYEYLKEKNISVDYSGVDICNEIVELAKLKNPDLCVSCQDLFKDNNTITGKFDLVYSSGIFNIDLGNNEDFLARAIKKFYQLSERFIVFNMLHENSPDRENMYFYTSPAEVKTIIKSSGLKFKKILVVEGYLDNDFTIICEK